MYKKVALPTTAVQRRKKYWGEGVKLPKKTKNKTNIPSTNNYARLHRPFWLRVGAGGLFDGETARFLDGLGEFLVHSL